MYKLNLFIILILISCSLLLANDQDKVTKLLNNINNNSYWDSEQDRNELVTIYIRNHKLIISSLTDRLEDASDNYISNSLNVLSHICNRYGLIMTIQQLDKIKTLKNHPYVTGNKKGIYTDMIELIILKVKIIP